jgi:DNA-binding Lrp family transcriptional regulator
MSKWTAQVQVKWTKDAPVWENWNWLKKWKEVKWAASTMGEWDMILWVDCNSPEELEKFIHEKLRAKKWVSDTKSTWTKEVWSVWNDKGNKKAA